MSELTTAADAEKFIETLAGVIDRLRGLVEEETALVQAGRLRAAAALSATKSALAGRLLAEGERLTPNAKSLSLAAPAHCAALKRTQEIFHAALKKNMLVLATAHAVSEGIVRRLSSDLARKAAPQIYGASGRPNAPNARQGRPLAISRTL